MCGICGILHRDGQPVDPALLARMTGIMEHRGPDDEGMLIDGALGLGFRRLSIIDLSGGHQPMANEDGLVHVVFNGEIYNFKDLRAYLQTRGHQFRTSSDTEVIVHGYEEWGDEVVSRLNGMFAFAVWDRRRRRLLLARDRIGIKPLFYCKHESTFAFASEIKSLLQLSGFEPAVSSRGVADFFSHLYMPAPQTIFEHVAALPPGHTLVAENGSMEVSCFWKPQPVVGPERNMEDWCEELRSRILDAVRRQMVADVPIGVWLSGGLDSSAVTAAMARAGAKEIRSFSVGFDVARYDETRFAELVGNHVGTTHETFRLSDSGAADILPRLLWYLDEPTADATIIPTYLLSQRTRQRVKVVLGGEGGDELFAGYTHYQGMQFNRWLRILPRSVRRCLCVLAAASAPSLGGAAGLGYRLHRLENIAASSLLPPFEDYLNKVSLFTPDEQRLLFSDDFREEMKGYEHLGALRSAAADQADLDPVARACLADLAVYLPGDMLVKLDRMSMACSLEARVPLLDNEVVDFALTIPIRYKINHLLRTKALFRQAMKEWLPREIFERSKQAFNPPLEFWLQRSLIRYAESHRMVETLRETGYFNLPHVHSLMEEHIRGHRNHSRKLWALLVFAVWWRRVRGAREMPS